ncbi:MAG: hypothetical protein VW124_14345 [Paracoccaceae bacterium]
MANLNRIWMVDDAWKRISHKENLEAVGLGHRKYPGYSKKKFIGEIRKLGVKPHKFIEYSRLPFRGVKFLVLTDNYIKRRFVWLILIARLLNCKVVAVLLESPRVKPWVFENIKKIGSKFDLIVTSDKSTLETFSRNSVFLNVTGITVPIVEPNFEERTFLCSYLFNSEKKITEGHRFRAQIYETLRGHEFADQIKIFETSFGLKKLDTLKDTYYSIVVHNSDDDYYFTDQILDCFAAGVVPIHWGSSGYKKEFDSSGVVNFKTLDDLKTILSNISINDFRNRIGAIKKNQMLVSKYKDMDSELHRVITEKLRIID